MEISRNQKLRNRVEQYAFLGVHPLIVKKTLVASNSSILHLLFLG